MTERYAGINYEVFEIWEWYKRALANNTIPGIPKKYWKYDSFTNGERIPKAARVFYRRRADLLAYFKDPFDSQGNSLYNWFQREEPMLLSDHAT